MLHFTFKITNPWGADNFKNLFCKNGIITKHKAWEFEVIKYSETIVALAFSFTAQRDHAGLNIEVGLFGYDVYFKIYDTRHWNYELRTWEE